LLITSVLGARRDSADVQIHPYDVAHALEISGRNIFGSLDLGLPQGDVEFHRLSDAHLLVMTGVTLIRYRCLMVPARQAKQFNSEVSQKPFEAGADTERGFDQLCGVLRNSPFLLDATWCMKQIDTIQHSIPEFPFFHKDVSYDNGSGYGRPYGMHDIRWFAIERVADTLIYRYAHRCNSYAKGAILWFHILHPAFSIRKHGRNSPIYSVLQKALLRNGFETYWLDSLPRVAEYTGLPLPPDAVASLDAMYTELFGPQVYSSFDCAD